MSNSRKATRIATPSASSTLCASTLLQVKEKNDLLETPIQIQTAQILQNSSLSSSKSLHVRAASKATPKARMPTQSGVGSAMILRSNATGDGSTVTPRLVLEKERDALRLTPLRPLSVFHNSSNFVPRHQPKSPSALRPTVDTSFTFPSPPLSSSKDSSRSIVDNGREGASDGKSRFWNQVEFEEEAIAIAEEKAAILEAQAELNARSALLCRREAVLEKERIRVYRDQESRRKRSEEQRALDPKDEVEKLPKERVFELKPDTLSAQEIQSPLKTSTKAESLTRVATDVGKNGKGRKEIPVEGRSDRGATQSDKTSVEESITRIRKSEDFSHLFELDPSQHSSMREETILPFDDYYTERFGPMTTS